MVDSAWLKWARAVEHMRVLARSTREFGAVDSYEYVRTDNAADVDDPLVRMHWRIVVKAPYPDRWSVLLGDVLTNLRAALDHVFWLAVIAHSGPPAQPHQVAFPITTTTKSFAHQTARLAALVDPRIWETVEAMQPFHEGVQAHTSPLEVLRWLSNVDKHRAVHIVGRTVFDMGPTIVRSPTPLEVVDDWRLEGEAADGAVVARLKIRRPPASQEIDLMPTFAHIASIQISEEPVDFRSLPSAMDVMREHVLYTLVALTDRLGRAYPDTGDFELGEEHEAYATEFGDPKFAP